MTAVLSHHLSPSHPVLSSVALSNLRLSNPATDDLLDALFTLPARGEDTHTYLGRVVAEVAARPDFWERFVTFTDQERYRVRIPLPVDAEVWLITWRTFQSTDLHDHGASDAAFATVRGALHEIRPIHGRLIPRQIIPGIVHPIPAGQIHDVRNELATPAVSIHAYAPRLEVTTYYSWRDGAARFERTEIGEEADASGWF